ncbi:hypothetical protein FBQ87_11570 [Sphingobacteriales bacterium CHB3]|nr:hypothetical protein [Sphingobacteriales bacterium CHB3]
MKKKFDAVKMKNDIQASMYAEMKDMTPKQRLQYIRSRAEAFRKQLGAGTAAPQRPPRKKRQRLHSA